MKKLFILTALLSLLAVSCKEEVIMEDVLEVVSTSAVVGVEGATQQLEFVTNTPWTISSDQDWVTFDAASGEAGKASVKVTVAANDTYEGRSAKVTVEAGVKTSTVTVSQFGKTEFGSTLSFLVSSEEQDITIPYVGNIDHSVNLNDNCKDWITVVKSKAAPVAGEIVLHVAANTELFPREGEFEIVAGPVVQKYVVSQSSDYTPLKTATALYLGSVQDVYDEENYEYNTFRQYAVLLSDEEGNTVMLALNGDENSLNDVLPAGVYSVDNDGKRSAGTFSLKSTSGHEKYYTAIFAGEQEITVYDGGVNVTVADGVYTITAVFLDSADNIHSYSYQGAISVADKSFGANCYDICKQGQYYTYFAGGAQQWNVTLNVSDRDKADNPLIRSITLTVYGTPAQDSALPTGDFAYEVPAEDETLGKPNGVTRANPQTFTVSGYDEDGNSFNVKDGTAPTLKITDNGDNTYTYSLKGDFVIVEETYDDDWNLIDTKTTEFSYSANFEDVYAPEYSLGAQASPDQDTEFTSVMNAKYPAYYYGKVFDESNDVFYTGFTYVNGNFNVNLSFNVKGNYVFEKNYSNKYCSTPFNFGKFEFSKTAVDNSLIPLKQSSTPRTYIQNTYTGTVFYITGGYVELTATTIVYNLTAKPKGSDTEFKFTGSHPAEFYYARDFTANASKLGLFDIQ